LKPNTQANIVRPRLLILRLGGSGSQRSGIRGVSRNTIGSPWTLTSPQPAWGEPISSPRRRQPAQLSARQGWRVAMADRPQQARRPPDPASPAVRAAACEARGALSIQLCRRI
jgi:hypothetical protein